MPNPISDTMINKVAKATRFSGIRNKSEEEYPVDLDQLLSITVERRGPDLHLAAMINYINENRRVNIVTVEQPIEFLHRHKEALIKQREVGGV